MNPFIIVLLAASQLLNNKIPPPGFYFGQIICSKPGDNYFNAGNGLWVYTNAVKYTYKHKKSTVTIICQLENNSADTLIFDRRAFSICSNSGEYVSKPWYLWERGLPIKQTDTIRILPRKYERSYEFEFTSKYNMPRKLMGSDTLRFQYTSGGQTSTIFPVVAVLEIDPTWTREQIYNAYTF